MIFNMTGGVPLNFTVKKYDSELLLHESAAGNTIAVITDKEITSWVFSAEEPSAPIEGVVWFAVGDGSTAEFNALKKHILNVYPQFTKQYIGGEWVDLTAYAYQGGEWVKVDLPLYYFFKAGEGAKVAYKTYKNTYSTIAVNTNAITVSHTMTASDFRTAFCATKPIDLEPYKTLYMTCTPSTVLTNQWHKDWYNSVGFCASELTTADPESSPWTARTKITASSTEKTITVDVSSIATSLYFAFHFSGTMTVKEIWLK